VNDELIKKWMKRAGLELVSLETTDSGHAIVTAKIPGDVETGAVALDLVKLEAASEREVESHLAYEMESLCGDLHVAWHFRGIKELEPDALLLQRGAPCPCGGKGIAGIDTKARIYRCERGIEHVFHRVTVIPHDGLVAVLYAEGSS
jgi:hypothetical protein